MKTARFPYLGIGAFTDDNGGRFMSISMWDNFSMFICGEYFQVYYSLN